METVEVTILPEWRDRADQYAKEARMRSMRTGKLAEYAVIDFLRKRGLFPREDMTPKNKPDYFDINLGSTLVDVKSCLAPAKELRVTKSHFDSGRRFAFYIGVQISRDRRKARIFGFCSKEDVQKAKFRRIGNRVAYVVPFSRLQPIEKLVHAFKPRDAF